jgi:hypothetical protein
MLSPKNQFVDGIEMGRGLESEKSTLCCRKDAEIEIAVYVQAGALMPGALSTACQTAQNGLG